MDKGYCMHLRFLLLFSLLNCAAVTHGAHAATGEAMVNKPPGGVEISADEGQRGLVDVVGYATTAAQMDQVASLSRSLAESRADALRQEQAWTSEPSFLAGICPHDDYTYAGRLYALLLPHIRAKTVILFGVFHKAKAFECRDRLVFDSFRTWRGPYGPVKVSPIREEILAGLSEHEYVVSDDMQMAEHSVEGIVPWLQAFNRDVEIVSILVPYMDWLTLDKLSGSLARALASILREKGWRLGSDVAFVISSDAVHYGDSGWGEADYAEFGADLEGYRMAVQRDRNLATEFLSGPVTEAKLQEFLHRCVDPQDVTAYRITWCGRFSVPFGLLAATRLMERLESRSLSGTLLDYGTSVSESSIEVEGLGSTAPNNFHHFVGYAAIGYR